MTSSHHRHACSCTCKRLRPESPVPFFLFHVRSQSVQLIPWFMLSAVSHREHMHFGTTAAPLLTSSRTMTYNAYYLTMPAEFISARNKRRIWTAQSFLGCFSGWNKYKAVLEHLLDPRLFYLKHAQRSFIVI